MRSFALLFQYKWQFIISKPFKLIKVIVIIIIQEIVHEVHIIYIYSKTRHVNIRKYIKDTKIK